MGRRIEARKGDNPAGSKPSSRCVEANDGLRVLTKRNPTALTSTDHQMVINANYLPLGLCLPVTKRVIRYMQISQSLESAMSAATRAAFRVARQTLQKYLAIAAPASTIDTSEGRRSLLSGPTTGVSAPRVRRYHATRRPRRASPSSSSSRVRFTAARVELVRPEEEPIGSSEGGYSDATRDVRILTIVHVDPR